MLAMTQLHDIRRLYFEEGRNVSEIAKTTGCDRKTVRHYINKADWNIEAPVIEPESNYPKLDQYKPDIDYWLTEDKKAKRKQRHTAQRVFDRLKDKYKDGFECSYRTVAGYVSKKKKEIFGKAPGFLPLEHIPGEAQVDFGDAEFYENGTLHGGKYLNVSFPFSNKGYLQLFKGENQECLFEGLKTIFEHIGGVPLRLWFDNMSTIVTKILKEGERNLTPDFLRFMEHHRFESVYCNKNSGNEKGNVEGKVGYHRRNMLVPIPRFSNLKVFNKGLLDQCEQDANREHYRKDGTHEDLYHEDHQALLKLPTEPFETCKYMTVKTNGYARFYLNNGLHEYSVAPKFANTRVLVRITAFEIIPLDENHREIVKHERFYGSYKQQSMKWLPYLTQLSKCPGALKYTGIYQMLPDPIKEYLEKCTKSEKGKVLMAIASLSEKSGFEKALATVNSALEYEAVDPDSLLTLHKRLHGKVVQLDPIRLPDQVPQVEIYKPNLLDYDKRLKMAGGTEC